MKWDPVKVLEESGKNFEKEWMEGINRVPEGSFKDEGKGVFHEVSSFSQELRQTLFSMGFEELFLPVTVSEKDLEKQLGTETVFSLPEFFFLSKPFRPRLASRREKEKQVLGIAPSLSSSRMDRLWELCEDFLSEKISSSQLRESMVEELGVRMEQTNPILNVVFESSGRASSGGTVLRRTALNSWFSSLSVLVKKKPLPLKAFSTGCCFSKEKKGFFPTVSWVVVGEEVSPKNMEEFLTPLWKAVGNVRLVTRKATSNQFVPGTQHSLLVVNQEVGWGGLLSPVALSEYGVGVPVFFGELDLAGLLSAKKSRKEREVLYPQFFGEWSLSDEQLGNMVYVRQKPSSDWGKKLSKLIAKNYELYGDHKCPCEFKVFEKEFSSEDKKIELWLIGRKNRLCGTDCLREVCVREGKVNALLPNQKKGVCTGVRLVNAFADKVSFEVEKNPFSPRSFSVEEAVSFSQANVGLSQLLVDYSVCHEKQLGLNASLELEAELRVKDLWRHEQP
jgi:O-phosphoseryl-tRNA synthetase